MKIKVIILIPLILIFTLQLSFAQINITSIDKLDNSTAVITEDSIVGEKLEQVQNQSNMTGDIVMNSGQKNK
jgi:hypothetical protein